MRNKPIIILNGEPNSIFIEILFKSIKKKKYNSPIILISSHELIKFYMKKFKFNKKVNLIDVDNFDQKKLFQNSINLIDVKFKLSKNLNKISNKSNKFINKSFNLGFELLNKVNTNKFINGPISKKNFLNKKHPGITEFIAKRFGIKKYAMLIYNKDLSVCPLTTHIPLKKVAKEITSKNIKDKVSLISNFYKKYRSLEPKIAILGLNPHCESKDKYNEDEKIIKPSIKHLKRLGYRVSGPYSADTIFLKQNRKKFNVILGMYHDQVLTPIKTIYEYDAINITLGLPFVRISPDHGPNQKMVGKNLSNPLSLIQAINFLDKN
tara:strand:- start:326 stop:1291 length:966 start_codon:yes stop_codon:yes gene_type:complete